MKKIAAVAALAGGIAAMGAGIANASADADGAAVGSPGVISGNNAEVPVHVPVNVCGNTVDILIAVLNPAFGNVCVNAG
ncbi:chaplin [Embleya scabrispora]|uniref:Chaplin n=1 Tax=Embleya scabrispora TaxID=159449 RepID=A0A1T3P785_9ACTN|nr:chaplin [Embleya scabrispora]OPC84862.1 chaplin [Embleya scabrispora]